MNKWWQRWGRPKSSLEDGELVELAHSGDQDAFRVLYERTHRQTAHAVARVLGHSSAVHDVVQDTYIKAHRSLNTYDTTRPFLPWLLQIARRTAISELRRTQDTVTLDHVRRYQTIDQWSKLTAREKLRTFTALLERLPEKEREALVLHDIEGMTLVEVAKMLEAPQGTIASRVRTARGRISDWMNTAHVSTKRFGGVP